MPKRIIDGETWYFSDPAPEDQNWMRYAWPGKLGWSLLAVAVLLAASVVAVLYSMK